MFIAVKQVKQCIDPYINIIGSDSEIKCLWWFSVIQVLVIQKVLLSRNLE